MKNKEFFAVIVFSILSAFLFPLLVQAVTVGPVKLEYSVDPGDVISGEIFLLNETKKAKTFYPTFEKYIEVDGKKKFLTGESEIEEWFELQGINGMLAFLGMLLIALIFATGGYLLFKNNLKGR